MEEVISADTVIIGNFKCSRPAKIHGQVMGDISSSHLVEISETGEVSGRVEAPQVSVRGIVMGGATATKSISISQGAIITGSLNAPAISR